MSKSRYIKGTWVFYINIVERGVFIKKRIRITTLVTITSILLMLVGCSSQLNQVSDHLSVANSIEARGESNAVAPEGHHDKGIDTDNVLGGSNIKDVNRHRALDERKIIRTANLEIETLDFEETVNAITGKTNSFGGYMEQSKTTGTRLYDSNNRRSVVMVLRIPTNRFMEFLNIMSDTGNVIHKEIGGEDVTYEYFDTEARLKSLKIQEDRLLSLLSKSDKLEDMIEVERELPILGIKSKCLPVL